MYMSRADNLSSGEQAKASNAGSRLRAKTNVLHLPAPDGVRRNTTVAASPADVTAVETASDRDTVADSSRLRLGVDIGVTVS